MISKVPVAASGKIANIQVIRNAWGFIGSSSVKLLFCVRSFAWMLRDHFKLKAI